MAAMADRLGWLAEYGYERAESYSGYETWRCVELARRVPSKAWGDLVAVFDCDGTGRDRVEISAGSFDNDTNHVTVAITGITAEDFRARLSWYESRAVRMLEAGLGVGA